MRIGWVLRRIAAFWETRRAYAGNVYFFLAFYDKIVSVKRRWPLPGRGRGYQLRMAGKSQPFSMRRGTTDLLILLEIFVKGEYIPVVSGLNGNCRTIVDFGANAGFSARLWTQAFPDCSVYAAELDSDNCAACRRNINLGGISNRVHLAQVCLVGHKRPVYIDRSFGKCGLRPTDKQTTEPPVMGTTVEEFLASVGVPDQIDLLKCDIEGAESELFKNCSGWIGRCRTIVAETHAPYNAQELVADIRKAGGKVKDHRRFGKENADLQLVFIDLDAGLQ